MGNDKPNAAYLLRKFIRRNKRQVIAASSILLALIAGLIVSLWQMNRAILAEKQAVVSRDNESKERQRADEQRDLANKNAELAMEGNRQAREALNAVTDDVMRSLFNKSSKLTENERQFLTRVLGLFDQLTKIEGDTAVAAEFRANGYWKIGEIQLQLGADEDAAKSYQNMRDMFEQQARLSPDALWPRQNLVGALRQASIALERTGRVDEANKLTDEADTIIAELISKFPNDQGLYYSQLVSRYDRIRRLPKNQQETAFRGFIESCEQHLKKYPDDHMASGLKLDAVNLLFDNVNLAENPAEAEKFDTIANKLTEQLSNVPEFSGSDYFLWQKVKVFQHHGGLLAAMGDYQGALDAYRRAIAISAKQMDQKTIQPWQWNEHMLSRYVVSDLLEKMKLWKESVVELRQAEKDVLQWSKTFPDPEQQLRHQADILHKIYVALKNGGESGEDFIAASRRAAEFREAKIDKFDSPKNNRLYIADYREVASYPLTEAKRYDEALAELQKALRVREELLLDFPKDPTPRMRLAETLARIGYSYFDLDQFLEASLQCQKGVEVYELLAKEFPDDRRYQQGIGSIQHIVGDRYRAKKKYDEAMASYRQAVIVRRELFESEPENWEYRSALAWTLHDWATVLLHIGRFEEGVEKSIEAVDVFQGGRRDSEGELVILRDWIIELDTRAWEMQSSNAQDASATKRALPVHRRVLEFRKRSVDDFPDDPQYLFHMVWSHVNIGSALLNLNQTDAAMNEFRMMTELLERHAVKFPNDMKLRQYFADEHDKIGERLRLAGFPGLGEDMYQVALKARESLAIDFPKEPFFSLQIAWSHFNIGEVRIEAKNESAGVAEMLECFARIDGLCRDGRKLPRVEFDGFVLKICRIFERFKLFEPLADVSTRYIDCVSQVWPDASSPNPEIAGLGGEALVILHKPAAAEPILRSAIGAMKSKSGWRYFYGQSLLGESLRAQGKIEEAESQLKEGYEGMKQRRSSIGFVNAPRFRTALEWLVKWAEDSNRAEEVEQWKAELARLDAESSEVNETKSP